MNRAVKIVIVAALLVIVAAVLISPAVDLQPSALRSALWSAALYAYLEVFAILFSGFRLVWVRERALPYLLHFSPNLISLIDLDCARLC
jgi:hypothetical protein